MRHLSTVITCILILALCLAAGYGLTRWGSKRQPPKPDIPAVKARVYPQPGDTLATLGARLGNSGFLMDRLNGRGDVLGETYSEGAEQTSLFANLVAYALPEKIILRDQDESNVIGHTFHAVGKDVYLLVALNFYVDTEVLLYKLQGGSFVCVDRVASGYSSYVGRHTALTVRQSPGIMADEVSLMIVYDGDVSSMCAEFYHHAAWATGRIVPVEVNQDLKTGRETKDGPASVRLQERKERPEPLPKAEVQRLLKKDLAEARKVFVNPEAMDGVRNLVPPK